MQKLQKNNQKNESQSLFTSAKARLLSLWRRRIFMTSDNNDEEADHQGECVDLQFSTETSEGGNGFAYIKWETTRLEPALVEGKTPVNNPDVSPILGARVRPATNDCVEENQCPDAAHYRGQVPLWIAANILPAHVRSSTECSAIHWESQSKQLAKIVCQRGYSDGEDLGMYVAGHLLAVSLAGEFVDFNLFPQERKLNRGNRLDGASTWHYWHGIETLIRRYLRTEKRNPRVELQVRLMYDDPTVPDLPTRIKFSVRFLRGVGGVNNEAKEIVKTIGSLLNSAVVTDEIAKFEECKAFYGNVIKLFAAEDSQDIGGLCREINQLWQIMQRKQSRKLSLLDVVPLVGTFRTLKESYEDFNDGKKVNGYLKVGLGLWSAYADMLMLRKISLSLRILLSPWLHALMTPENLADWGGDIFGHAVCQGVYRQLLKESAKRLIY